MKIIIYKVTNLINNKLYIGQTSGKLKTRWSKHVRSSLNFIKNSAFPQAIRKYSSKNFLIEEIDLCESNEEADYIEKYWIKFYKTQNNNYGYNIAEGGKTTRGIKHTPENVEKNRQGQIKRFETIESREKYSLIMKEKYASGEIIHGRMGKIDSEEIKDNMSARFKGKEPWNKGKEIPQMNRDNTAYQKPVRCIETGEIFDKVKDAADKYNHHISGALKNPNRTACGYHWEYINLEDKNKFGNKIICLNNNAIYSGPKEASEKLDLPYERIRNVLKQKSNNVQGYKFEYIKE